MTQLENYESLAPPPYAITGEQFLDVVTQFKKSHVDFGHPLRAVPRRLIMAWLRLDPIDQADIEDERGLATRDAALDAGVQVCESVAMKKATRKAQIAVAGTRRALLLDQLQTTAMRPDPDWENIVTESATIADSLPIRMFERRADFGQDSVRHAFYALSAKSLGAFAWAQTQRSDSYPAQSESRRLLSEVVLQSADFAASSYAAYAGARWRSVAVAV
jgi:hypothetical protein